MTINSPHNHQMRTSASHISPLRRLTLALITLCVVCIAPTRALAQLPQWSTSEARPPLGSGTQDDPYIIATAPNLLWLSLNLKKLSLADKWFIQTDDIDLQGREWIPIGGRSVGAFLGHYDGQGHSITGLKLDWGRTCLLANASGSIQRTAATTASYYGLFGYFGGTLSNLVIDGAEIIQTPGDAPSSTSSDAAIGILAGAVGDASLSITNVIVRNSSVSEASDNRLSATAYMVGGLIGDSHGDKIENTSANASRPHNISSIFVDVDFNLANTTLRSDRSWSDKGIQFYTGGIIGRGRSLRCSNQLPNNVIFTGSINAPLSMAGPIFGGSRYNNGATTTYDGLRYCYAGDFSDKAKGTASNAEFFSTAFYSDFQLYNYADPDTPVAATITDDDAASGLNVNDALSTRTFTTQASFTPSLTTTAAEMSMFQGVNRGTYTSSPAAAAASFSHPGYEWDFSGSSPIMTLSEPLTFTLNPSSPFLLTAQYDTSRTPDSPEGYVIKWYDYGTSVPVEITGSAIQTDGSTSTLNGLYDGKTILAVLFDGSFPLASRIVTINPAADGTAIVNTADNTYQLQFDGDTTIPAGFSISSWSVCDPQGVNYNIDHLSSAISPDKTTITLDDALTPRVLYATIDRDGDTPIFPWISVSPVTAEIVLDNGVYKPSINGSTDLSAFTPFTYRWRIDYDGGGSQSLTQASVDPSTDMEHPDYNAVISIIFTDNYTSTTLSTRYIADARSLTITRVENTLIALIDNEVPTDGTWQWYGISGDISDNDSGYLLDCDTNELTIDRTNDKYTNYCAVWTAPDASARLMGYYSTHNIIYVFDRDATIQYGGYSATLAFPDGSDTNLGRTPRTAVKTMERAYALLDADASPDHNIIVVMGYVNEPTFLKMSSNYLPQPKFAKCATIMGLYGQIAETGTLFLGYPSDTDGAIKGIGGSTTFREIILSGAGQGYLTFYCNLNDLTIGNNVVMKGYAVLPKNKYGLGDYNAPAITIVGAMHNFDNTPLIYPTTNATPGRTTIKILSGCFGRIIAGSRNNYATNASVPEAQRYNHKSFNICGHPDNPHRVDVLVSVKHINDMSDYCVSTTPYLYDIGLLVGGVTDGSIFTDSRLNMVAGSVGRFISGNISFGRPVGDEHPADGFFGSTELTLEGGEIGELIGGTLGRNETKEVYTPTCDAYFYGRSIIHINGGRVNGNVYGGGAGGVVGVGNDTYHTLDQMIPYLSDELDEYGRAKILYGPYEIAKDRLPRMKLQSTSSLLDVNPDDGSRSILDFGNSYTEVNINGGTVTGNVYGGGFGYSAQVVVDKALPQAGDIYGNTRVRINGGTILGSVFGGGAGSDAYYKASGDDRFRSLANVYGTAFVEICGGLIEGNVYGGSQGIANIPEMASVIGSTDLRISQVKMSDNSWSIPVINGDIYGGSQRGAIIGDTHLDISGGAIGQNIYGGSEGTNKPTDNTMATITGDTYIDITGGTFFTEQHAAKISPSHAVDPHDRMFNIYGAGNINCIVDGSTHVTIKKSLFASHLNLLESDIYPTFADCLDDLTYRKFSVYGGGRGLLTDVTGDTHLTIDIIEGASVPSSRPVDVANSQQFIRIAGGGFSGNVYGNTNVLLQGNVFARNIYGGGLYGRVEGEAVMDIHSGSFHNVYGGGLLGDIKHGSDLTIGVQANGPDDTDAAKANANIYIYGNVYGGNDVGGIVGYELSAHQWTCQHGDHYMIRKYDHGVVSEYPYSYHIGTDAYGVNLKIFGGNILGNVFGAGNGNHTGYYVPNSAQSEHHRAGFQRLKFTDGPAYLYHLDPTDPHNADRDLLTSEDDKKNWGLYEYRPRTMRVQMHIGGNSATDRVRIGESVYGGGDACTIGEYNPEKDVLTDPSRFVGGGVLKVNFGSHVTVGQGVYMGSRGQIIGKQTVSDGTSSSPTATESDYDYHYYDPATGTYRLGFPNSIEGRNRFHAYLKLIDLDAVTRLSFFDMPFNSEGDGADEFLPFDPDDPDPAGLEASDIRFGAFYAGGARGSMTYNAPGDAHCYHFILPPGLTVATHAVGGSDDAVVRFYQYAPDYTSFDTTKPLFTYYGGIVYDVNDGGVTGSGGGVVTWQNAPDGTPGKELIVGNETPRGERVVMKMDVRCQFDPPMSSYTDENGESHDARYGGIVYGGCFSSGITNGSVELVCSGNLLGSYFDSNDFHDYLSWSTLRYNVGRVFGGGYGSDASIRGRTNILLCDNFRGFNVFGGGMLGDVSRGSQITVAGSSMVYNAVYGGGMHGDIGLDPISGLVHDNNIGSNITLVSGGVDRVYGGAFMGDVYGGSHITASDADTSEGTPRLFVGSIFGGNDVAGVVYPDPDSGLSTEISVSETPRADKASYPLSHEAEASPGLFYSGYPVIGTIYGAGNGNMGDYIAGVTIDRDTHKYNGGSIHIANGHEADINVYNLGEMALNLPDVESSRISVTGGTIINLYGGGSMCTVTGHNIVEINYTDTVARAAFSATNQNQLIWGILRLFEELQQSEVTEVIGDHQRFSHQIYRVFGGNNLMDMAIQPGWDVRRGNLFSIYSGGNFGRMTYPDGLSLTLDSPDLRVASVYGGGRVGNIQASAPDGSPIVFDADKYGATLNISQGIYGDVYGGNNVAGTVYNGTNVNVSGAISGNLYASGNGNYIYLYDFDGSHSTPGEENRITEDFDQAYGGRYFILPPREAYTGHFYADTPEEKIIAINSYRPNVEKAYLNICGDDDSDVFVLGSVFCGGNSSTVLADPSKTIRDDIRLSIGSHVALGSVFLGSNGESLANPYRIAYLANINGISDLSAANRIDERPGFEPANKAKLHFRDQGAYDKSIYPNLLSLYMRAAEVTALPDRFTIPDDAHDVYVGNFTIGGNYGSMMTDETINLELPERLTLMGRVVGGCYNSRIEYNGAVALGGMPKPLKDGLTDRLNLSVKCQFRPWRLYFDPLTHKVSLANNLSDSSDNLVDDPDATPGDSYYYPEGTGNIFGGCYTSGTTVGDIHIDLYTDMLGYYNDDATPVPSPALSHKVNLDMLMNNINTHRPVFAVTGAGYGSLSEVHGNVTVRLLPKPSATEVTTHPSIATIFGGSHNGSHVGTSTTEIRDGLVFSSLYAGSRAAFKYGSSEVIVGYPAYYRCLRDGIYTLNRADNISYIARATQAPDGTYTHPITGKTYPSTNNGAAQVIKQSVRYRKGEIVPANVVDRVVGFKLADADSPTAVSDVSLYFGARRETPADFSSRWDNISINIGDNSNMNDPEAKFYGGGGIYGGGHALNASAMTFSGVNTQLAYTADNNPDSDPASGAIGYGGNSSIIVGDNPANNAISDDGQLLYTASGPLGEAIRDHVSIGTAHYVPISLDPVTGDKIGYYTRKVDPSGKVTFIHQSAGTPVSGETYYTMESQGGIFGDGRRTFVEKFRAVDIEGYGYADYTPLRPKLINAFQRIDLLSLSDCCLQLQGATDYATNSVDATPYSIARIGELRLNSSLKGDLVPSSDDPDVPGNISIDVPRSRNYMGFFRSIHYLGAIASSTPMEPADGDSFKEGTFRGPDGAMVSGKSYRSAKNDAIRRYESISDADDPEVKSAKQLDFKKRNTATAPNMIGINNGYTLKVQNVYTSEGTGSQDGILKYDVQDNIYYGPILGVVEVNLLTLARDEGGGYIYAFNSHSDDPDDPGFLEASGNFVYPAAVNEDTDNYIVDDCYPGSYYTSAAYKDSEEIHYWYVTGHHYYYNATLTGYTFNGPAIDFRLNNADNLILLSGIEASTAEHIRVESIAWENHVDDGYQCALTDDLDPSDADSRAKYQLFMSIDKSTHNDYDLTDAGHAFVAQIPNGNGPDAYGTDNGAIRVVNNYSDYSAESPNSPTLGIRLHDTDSSNQNPDFFHNHLERPDNVVIKLAAKDFEGNDVYYDIRLNITYLQGPYINGKIVIENCALPGEYIYANTSDVEVEMDESLTVTAKRWYLYPRIKNNPAQDIYSWDNSPEGRVDVSRYLMDNISGDINRIQLPARYYQDDWMLGYAIVVNGQDFPLDVPDAESGSNLLSVHNYHRMSTVAKSIKEMTRRHNPSYPFDLDDGNCLVSTYGFDIDLDLVGGALVYIEDDEDFAIFTKYVNYCNEVRRDAAGQVIYHTEGDTQVATAVAQVLPGYNAEGYVTGLTNRKTLTGYLDWQDIPYLNVKNPPGAQNIRFVLTADVHADQHCLPISEFRGRFNGLGHNIHIDPSFPGTNFIDVNYGDIHDVGFTASRGLDSPSKPSAIINVNKGEVHNSYFFNFPEGHPETLTDYADSRYTSLIGSNEVEETQEENVRYVGIADNCYQNTDQDNADDLAGVRFRTTQTFHNGMVAYNLNQEYLKARFNSRNDDALVRETMLDASTDPRYIPIDYLYSYYADGEYRYAYPRSTEHPEGLRLPDNFGVPNYENYMGNFQSMHYSGDDAVPDSRRWFQVSEPKIKARDSHGAIIYDSEGRPVMTDEGYFPIYLYDSAHELASHSDFIFFGQRLTSGAHRDYYPRHITDDTRVYRSGGFYGSDTDFGFHFNRNIVAMQPLLTAIDFTGNNDLPDASSPGKSIFARDWQFWTLNSPAGHDDYTYYPQPDDIHYSEIIEHSELSELKQLIFYPPVMDLPGGEHNSYLANINSFNVDSNTDLDHHDRITRNLLVYTPGVGTTSDDISADDNSRLFSMFHYTRLQQWGDPEGETPQENIIGHQLYRVSHQTMTQPHFHSANGLFHLVDGQNFNAPIEFYVSPYDEGGLTSGRAWLKRKPIAYASLVRPDDPEAYAISKDAWESIALPFTCNRVWAVNKDDYIEKYSRGQISHFYGTDPDLGVTHHDYWLRGLVSTAADTRDGDDVVASADFARPGISTPELPLFEIRNDQGSDEQMRGDYTFYNDWFYNSFKDLAYNENHNEYGQPMTFEQYPYLTKNAPYIVAYPGEDYYEFDLSGKFYNSMHATEGCHEQEILYEFSVDEIDPNNNFELEDRNVRIPVTDYYDSVRHTSVTSTDGTVTTHHATFSLIEGDAITDNMYVINPVKVTADINGTYVDIPVGGAFINCRDFGIQRILPFRTYLTVDLPAAHQGSKSRFILIGSRGAEGEPPSQSPDEPQEEEPQSPDDEMVSQLRVWVEGTTLKVESPADTTLRLVNMLGQQIRLLNVYTGVNSYSGIPAGFYLAGSTKVYIP